MTSSNIDVFNENVGKIFADLYNSFPVPKEIHPRDFVGIGIAVESESTFEFSSQEKPKSSEILFFSTVQWLIREGYISATELLPTQVYFRTVVLTQKGLMVLNAVPDSLANKQSLGDRLVSSAKSGAIDLLKSAAKEALSIGIKSLTG